jgi:hypothetical protein
MFLHEDADRPNGWWMWPPQGEGHIARRLTFYDDRSARSSSDRLMPIGTFLLSRRNFLSPARSIQWFGGLADLRISSKKILVFEGKLREILIEGAEADASATPPTGD